MLWREHGGGSDQRRIREALPREKVFQEEEKVFLIRGQVTRKSPVGWDIWLREAALEKNYRGGFEPFTSRGPCAARAQAGALCWLVTLQHEPGDPPTCP